MLFGETIAVYCENHTEHTDTVRTSQETYYVSATETNRLMLFGETIAVYCENHTEYTNTVRTSQKTRYISATETIRLMQFGETVAVYCENHTEHINTIHCVGRVHNCLTPQKAVRVVTCDIDSHYAPRILTASRRILAVPQDLCVRLFKRTQYVLSI
jgi:translation initiation factor IF-1